MTISRYIVFKWPPIVLTLCHCWSILIHQCKVLTALGICQLSLGCADLGKLAVGGMSWVRGRHWTVYLTAQGRGGVQHYICWHKMGFSWEELLTVSKPVYEQNFWKSEVSSFLHHPLFLPPPHPPKLIGVFISKDKLHNSDQCGCVLEKGTSEWRWRGQTRAEAKVILSGWAKYGGG